MKVCVGVFKSVWVCVFWLLKRPWHKHRGQRCWPRSRTNWREAPQTKRNEKTPNRENSGKNTNCTPCTWAKNYFWKGHPFHSVWKVVLCSCFVRVVQHVKSSGHTATAPSVYVRVCVCLVKRLVQDFWKFLRLFWVWVRGRGGGEVGPLEAQCRPFNDAASGKFVQIVYGYCTFIHTAEHTKRDRERGGWKEIEHSLFACSGGL